MQNLPEIKEVPVWDGPPTFSCPELGVNFYRLRASWAPARKSPGGLALLGEETVNRKIFILWFQEFSDTGELLSKLQTLVIEYRIQEFYARLTKAEHHFLSYYNSQRDFRQRLTCQRPVWAEDDGCIDFHLNLIAELLKPASQKIFFPADSNMPQLLQSLSDQEAAHGISDIDHPAVASIVYGISALHHFPTAEAQGLKKKKEYDPWALLNS